MPAEMNKTTKVGIISCSGEEIAEGTISRSAVRRVLESLRPQETVTLCLPLFLAGNEGERNFARTHPTITIDGCDKQVVSDILGKAAVGSQRSSRSSGPADEEAVRLVADEIASAVDTILDGQRPAEDDAGDA